MALPPLNPDKPMDGLTRRSFLKASGVAGAAALLAGGAAVTYREVMDRGAATPLPQGSPILVLLTMYGGNDSLNTVIPYADAAYHDARPELAYRPEEVLRLDDAMGLNPGLKGVEQLWRQKKVAIVRGVGYPRPDRSHFRSMDIWQTASPERPVTSGWIGRWLDANGDDPLRALNIGEVLPPVGVGTRATAAALSIGERNGRTGGAAGALAAFGAADPADGPAVRMVRASYAAQVHCERTLGGVVGSERGEEQEGDSGGGANRNALPDQLDMVARCIKADVPTTVYLVSVSGFDTHAREKDAQTGRLTDVDKALTAFRSALAGHPREKDVVVTAYSEFGRRVKANASDGTDHGTAGALFVMGDRVKGGCYGEQPSLTDLDDGDLKSTTDFRGVYGELLHGLLRTDPARVLDRVPEPLGFLV